MPDVFITGGSGFVGSWIARYLYQRGYKLNLLLRENSSNELISDLKYKKIVGDMVRPDCYENCPDFDYLIHAGALVRTVKNSDYYRVNTEGTKFLIEFAKKRDIKGIIFISSITALGPREIEAPVSHYGLSKKLAEKIVQQSDIPYLILRLPIVYGPGDREGIRIFKLLQKHILFLPGHDLKLSLIYVRDVAEMVSRLVNEDYFPNKAINISDNQIYNLSDVLKIASFLMHKKTVTISPPFCLLGLISVILDGIARDHEMITRDKLREFKYRNWVLPATPEDMNFQPKYDIEAGLSEILKNI